MVAAQRLRPKQAKKRGRAP
ncbi:hypothetical protein JMJ77_0004597 [Colletotrichum scovillei]|uniref:Uncharacterized protein n=1 Tax=Colletotrichum scovillei TaxID=1209932 RepID=A0A9P7UHZ3_9PEZI|nr:hypothetical protein JMJ77_0004597 [Colletotrichum scovillei]KAG7075806.1 hypothetical protein JMJ76_0013081 [Colletotrichum scovillei]KAG7082848.1 hypothetical protein JMJ78_0008302 [Colletotrichum scovillei]